MSQSYAQKHYKRLSLNLSSGFIQQVNKNLPKNCDWLVPVLQIADIVRYPPHMSDGNIQYKVVWSDGIHLISGGLSPELSKELVGDTEPESNKYTIVTLDKYQRLVSRKGKVYIFAEESNSIFMYGRIIGEHSLKNIQNGASFPIVDQKLDRILQKWRSKNVEEYV